MKRSTKLRSSLTRVLGMLMVVLFCAAPTPGDIGGCGQKAQPLDEDVFFETKQYIDCDRCKECDLQTARCEQACQDEPIQQAFPERCEPLVHDGEVCLRKLLAVSCSDYRYFMDDERPEIPTECDFCPLRAEQ